MAAIVIPAHNEERVIGRLLTALLAGAEPGELDVVVVSNGSTDDTAGVARRFPGVRVLELDEGSKHLALQAGDRATTGFPRFYVDADIEIDLASIRALVAALEDEHVLAVAPARRLDLDGSSWAVRAHYRVWEQLAVVQEGLFGRGVLGVDEAGYARIADRPHVLGDDLYLHSRFTGEQRRIVMSACSVVRGPRTLGDLLRRRARAAQGNAELAGLAAPTTTSSARQALAVLRTSPQLTPSVAVFVAVTAAGRVRGRWMRARGTSTWLRDESSRS